MWRRIPVFSPVIRIWPAWAPLRIGPRSRDFPPLRRWTSCSTRKATNYGRRSMDSAFTRRFAPHRYLDPKVVNAADLVSRAVAPGSLISILGAQVSVVRAGDVTIPVLSATSSGSQLQVPFDIGGNSLGLVATGTSTGTAGLVFTPLPVAAAAPAIFVGPDATPMLLDGDSGVLLDAMTPAHSGGRIQILAAGLGRVTPDWPAGLPAPAENPPHVAGTVRAFLDRTPVEVTRSVLAPGYVGLYLVEITVPKIAN